MCVNELTLSLLFYLLCRLFSESRLAVFYLSNSSIHIDLVGKCRLLLYNRTGAGAAAAADLNWKIFTFPSFI